MSVRRRSTLLLALSVLALPVASGGPVHAQPASDGTGAGFAQPQPGAMRGSKMIGLPVVGMDHVRVGSIEAVLIGDAGKVEAVVIGVDDPYRGQSPKAFVTLHPDSAVTGAELRDFLRDKVSKIELPREVEIRDALPKTLIGKLSKKELVEEEKAKAAARE